MIITKHCSPFSTAYSSCNQVLNMSVNQLASYFTATLLFYPRLYCLLFMCKLSYSLIPSLPPSLLPTSPSSLSLPSWNLIDPGGANYLFPSWLCNQHMRSVLIPAIFCTKVISRNKDRTDFFFTLSSFLEPKPGRVCRLQYNQKQTLLNALRNSQIPRLTSAAWCVNACICANGIYKRVYWNTKRRVQM